MIVEEIIIIGAGGHARACIEVIETEGKYKIAGLVGTKNEIGNVVSGYKVLGTENEIPLYAATFPNAIIGIGQIDSAETRRRIFANLKKVGFKLPAIISPYAHVARNAQIGFGSIIMHHALVNTGVIIGENCIVNSKATVEHDSVIGDSSHISTGTIINGGCVIGHSSFIGSGSVVKEGCTVGEESIIGMSLGVRKDIPSKCVYTGESKK